MASAIKLSAAELAAIKALRSNNGSMYATIEDEKPVSRKRSRDAFTVIVSPANHRFSNYLVKNNEIKFECLDHELSYSSDPQEAKRCFMAQCTRLMDNRPYMKECKVLDVKPLTLATHIAFRGKTCISKVIKNGIVATIGESWYHYTEDFLPTDMLKMSEDYSAENCASYKD